MKNWLIGAFIGTTALISAITLNNTSAESFKDRYHELNSKRQLSIAEQIEWKSVKKKYDKTVRFQTKSKNISKIRQYEQLIRGEIAMDLKGNLLDASGYEKYEPFYKANAYNKAVSNPALRQRSKNANATSFEHKGPGFGYVSGSNKLKKFSGRAIDFAVHPTTTAIIYVATAGGGIYKTENSGEKWEFSSNGIPHLVTGAVAISASNPSVLYAGTGDYFGQSDKGNGLFKSTDAGKTWQVVNASLNDNFTYITDLHINPKDEKHVLVATTKGLFITKDAGATFTKSAGISGAVTSVAINPKHFPSMYVAVHSEGIYKSLDAGNSFSKAYDASSLAKRMSIATTEADTSVVYGLAEGSSDEKSKFFKTVDAGKTWNELKQTGTSVNIFQTGGADQPGGQGWYDQSIAVNPYDATVFYVGGIDIYRAVSEKTKTDVALERRSEGYEFSSAIAYCHVDQHGMMIIPKGQGQFDLFFANDGGVAMSSDEGKTYHQRVSGMDNIQLYASTKHPTKKRYFGGAQDNGSPLSPENPTAETAYDEQIGGDGFGVIWHYTDPNKMFGSIYSARIAYSSDEGKNWEELNYPGANQGSFITRMGYSNASPEMIAVPAGGKMHVSHNFGKTWISKDPARASAGGFGGQLNTEVAISQADGRIIWGADFAQSGSLGPVVSTDAGYTYTHITSLPSDIDKQYPVSGLATHPKEPNTAFLTFSIAKKPHILRTKDLGKTWEDLTTSGSNFPDVATYCVQVMPHDLKGIWAGTEIGLFISKDDGKTWTIETQVPPVSIRSLRVVKDEVVIGTYGRGIYSAKIPEHNPEPTVLSPSLTLVESQASNAISVNVSVITAVDSTIISKTFNGATEVKTIKPQQGTNSYSYPYTQAGAYTFKLKSFISGKTYETDAQTITVSIKQITTIEKMNISFDGSNINALKLEKFSVEKPEGFNSKGLHTSHPVVVSEKEEFIAQFKNPIKINQHTDFLQFRAQVLLSDIYEGKKYDYLMIEASTDLNSWSPISEIIDADLHSEWKTEAVKYASAKGSESLHKVVKISLDQTKYKMGENIFVRFRVNAEGYQGEENSYGIAIDDIAVQTDMQGGGNGGEPQKPVELNYTFAQNPQFLKNAYLFASASEKLHQLKAVHQKENGQTADLSFTPFQASENLYLNKDLTVDANSKHIFYIEAVTFGTDGKPKQTSEKDTLVVQTYINQMRPLRHKNLSLRVSNEQALPVAFYKVKSIHGLQATEAITVGYDQKRANENYTISFDVPQEKRDFVHLFKRQKNEWVEVRGQKTAQGVELSSNTFGTYAIAIGESVNSMLSEITKFELKPNFPNPFNPTTTISFGITQNTTVSLIIYNALGQEVKTLVNKQLPAGTHAFTWNATNQMGSKVASGIYFYKLITPQRVLSRKMVLLK